MMIQQINNESLLTDFLISECIENGIGIIIDPSINADQVVMIKVDNYYNSLGLKETPASVDFLISLKIVNDQFVIYLVEAKNICSTQSFTIKNISDKFKNTIRDFMGVKFSYIFLNQQYTIRDLKLFFVTDPLDFGKKGILDRELIRKRIIGTKLETLLLQKPLLFKGKRYSIQYEIPNPLIRFPE